MHSAARRQLRRINPLFLEDQDDFFLAEFLRQQAANRKFNFYVGKRYPLQMPDPERPGSSLIVYVTFTHDLIGRTRIRNGELRYSVIDLRNSPFPEGGTGKVYPILATLAEQPNKRIKCKKHKKRIMKVCPYSKMAAENAENECDESIISLHVPHLKAKAITIDPDTDQLFLEMQEFKGKELASVLDHERPFPARGKPWGNVLTLLQRLQITINILRAMKEQFHDHGIAHRDIKPENILVDVATNEVNIIDAGFSLFETDANKTIKIVGTPAYYPPEAFSDDRKVARSPLNQKSDLYSLGLSLSELWHAEQRNGNDPKLYINAIMANREPADFSRIFSKIDDLLPEEKTRIRGLIKDQLMHFNPNDRPSLDDAIRDFEDIKLNIKKRGLPINLQEDIQNAHAIGLQLRHFSRTKQQDPTQTILIKLQELPEYQPAMDEFVETSGFTILRGLSKAAAIAKIQQIETQFQNNRIKLQQLENTIRNRNHDLQLPVLKQRFAAMKMHVEQARQMAEHLRDKLSHHAGTINELEAFNINFNMRAFQLDRHLHTGLFAKSRAKEMYESYQVIFPLLKIKDDATVHDAIRIAIKSYIDATLTTGSMAKFDRAASDRRRQDILEILCLVNTINDRDHLMRAVSRRLESIQTGWLGRSELRDKVRNMLHEYCEHFRIAVP